MVPLPEPVASDVGSAPQGSSMSGRELLPQPGGFEGLGLAVVAAQPDHPTVAPVGQVPHRLVNRSTAFAAVASKHAAWRAGVVQSV